MQTKILSNSIQRARERLQFSLEKVIFNTIIHNKKQVEICKQSVENWDNIIDNLIQFKKNEELKELEQNKIDNFRKSCLRDKQNFLIDMIDKINSEKNIEIKFLIYQKFQLYCCIYVENENK